MCPLAVIGKRITSGVFLLLTETGVPCGTEHSSQGLPIRFDSGSGLHNIVSQLMRSYFFSLRDLFQ